MERLLGVDLDAVMPDATADDRIAGRLGKLGLSPPVVASCKSAVRHYACARAGTVATAPSSPAPQLPARSTALRDLGVSDLMRLYADVLDELRDRGVTRTANGPVGDYAEQLYALAFGWTLAGPSAAQHDAIDDAGVRYQIKGRRMAGGSGWRQLGAFRRLPDAGFDTLAAILFDRTLEVRRAALIPHRIVLERARRSDHVNGWRFVMTDEVWMLPGFDEVTGALRDAAERV